MYITDKNVFDDASVAAATEDLWGVVEWHLELDRRGSLTEKMRS